MLLGWLFLGGAGIAAVLTNTVRRAKGISNKERMYTDVKGVTRYTKNKLSLVSIRCYLKLLLVNHKALY